MALLTWITIFPLIMFVVELLGPLLEDVSEIARLGITTAVTVPLMTWVVMPRVTRLLRSWLYLATVIVKHAINTDGEGLWYPDLRAELTKRGHDVEVLELPNPDAPSPAPWLATLTDAVGASAPSDTVLVATRWRSPQSDKRLEAGDWLFA
jgi:hypothetical protein